MEWIKCSERMPKYGQPVLLVYRGVVQFSVYARDIGEFRSLADDESDHAAESEFSHWMPLPDSPKEQPHA